MLIGATRHGCVPQAALCAALVSGRELLMRLGRDDAPISEARETFEVDPLSNFYTFLAAYDWAKQRDFQVDSRRRYGIHAQTALQVRQTFEQILRLAEGRRLLETGATGGQRSVAGWSTDLSPGSAASRNGGESLLR